TQYAADSSVQPLWGRVAAEHCRSASRARKTVSHSRYGTFSRHRTIACQYLLISLDHLAPDRVPRESFFNAAATAPSHLLCWLGVIQQLQKRFPNLFSVTVCRDPRVGLRNVRRDTHVS